MSKEYVHVLSECRAVHLCRRALTVVMLSSLCLYTHGASEAVDGIVWQYSVVDGTAKITSIPSSTTGTITTPVTLGGKTVTHIGDHAFFYCRGLTSVIIPKGVVSIGQSAFYNCSELTNIEICASVTNVGHSAFYGCKGLTHLSIPAGVLSIGDCTFYGCSGLTSVSIPSDVTRIGASAFSGCCGLTSISIPSNVTDIGSLAFSGCTGLGDGVIIVDGCVLTVNGTCPESIEVPNGSRLIAGGAFSSRNGLTSIAIPEGVTSIGDDAFRECRYLTNIAMPLSVTNIGKYAFYNCTALKDVIIPPNVTSIGEYTFYDCYTLTDMEIPSGVASIGDCALQYCSGLTNVTIASGLKQIGSAAFRDCSGLLRITLPLSVTRIHSGAFIGCSSLKGDWEAWQYWGSTTDPNPESDWMGNTSYRHFAVLAKFVCVNGCIFVADYDKREWQDAYSEIHSIPSSIVVPPDVDFPENIRLFVADENYSGIWYFWPRLTSVSIPEGVTSIEGHAFYSRPAVTNVTISSTVTNIGDSAFSSCSRLTNVVTVGDAPQCGHEPFAHVASGCEVLVKYGTHGWDEDGDGYWQGMKIRYTNLPKADGGPYTEMVGGIRWTFTVTNGEACVTGVPEDVAGSVTIPETLGGRTVTEIATNALSGCAELTSVTIPAGVTKIGAEAFSDCPKLADVTFAGDTVSSIAGDAFARCNWDLVVHVPNGWTGRSTSLFGHTVVREDASESQSVYLTVTNVVVQYVLNSVQPEIAVPVSGDTGFVAVITDVKSSGAVSVPSEWKDNYPSFTATYGSDMGKALMMKTGKKDGAGNEMLVWQDFVAGTDPTDENDKFTASITMVDGAPVVSYTPELTPEQTALRTYKTFGKKQLQDTDWTDITDLDGDAKKPYNFFKVTVEMK